MKTDQELRKDSLAFALGIALGAIGGWLLTRKKAAHKLTAHPILKEQNLEFKLNESSTKLMEEIITPFYWGTTSGNEALKNLSFVEGTPIDHNTMLKYISPYAKRIKGVAPGKVDLNKEKFMVLMDRPLVEAFLKNQNMGDGAECLGLAAIFAIEVDESSKLKNQTVILMPYGKKKGSKVIQILKLDLNGGLKPQTMGAERWDASFGKSVYDVLKNNASTGEPAPNTGATVSDDEVDIKIRDYFVKEVWKIKQ